MNEIRESITLKNRQQKIFSIFHLPSQASIAKFPAVLLAHGFGGNKSGKFRLFVRLAELLTSVGVAVLRFDFRGAGDSEGDFQNTTIEGMLEDAMISLDWLSNHPKVDSNRIGIVGRSLGGLLSVLTASRTPLIKALVLWAAVFDAKPWIEKGIGTKIPFQHQGVQLNNDFLAQFSALKMQEIMPSLSHTPLLYVQAIKDTSVEQYHADQYAAARRVADAKTQFLTFPNSDHEFSDCNEQATILQETVNWLTMYL